MDLKAAQSYMLWLAKKAGVRDVDDVVGEANLIFTRATNKSPSYLQAVLRLGFLNWLNSQTCLHFPARIRKNANKVLQKNPGLSLLLKKSKKPAPLPPDLQYPEKKVIELDCLGDKERIDLDKFFFGGYTLEELAKESGVSHQAIHKRIQKSLKILREEYGLHKTIPAVAR